MSFQQLNPGFTQGKGGEQSGGLQVKNVEKSRRQAQIMLPFLLENFWGIFEEKLAFLEKQLFFEGVRRRGQQEFLLNIHKTPAV